MLILMDDGRAHPPTRRNIEDAFQRICQYSVAGDIVWIHYSGHGSRVRDVSGDEEDGYDSTLIPVDFRSTGQILDDDGPYLSSCLICLVPCTVANNKSTVFSQC
jgi:metacaspase-1